MKTNRIDIYQLSGTGPALLGNAFWLSPRTWRTGFSLKRLFKYLFNKPHKKRKFKMTQLKYALEQVVKTSFESNTYFHFSLIQSSVNGIQAEWIIKQARKYL